MRGITAGVGSACTEMKLAMIRIIRKALRAHPKITPCCFVDDYRPTNIGCDDHVVEELGGFIEVIAEECRINALELSGTKCVATASTKKLG